MKLLLWPENNDRINGTNKKPLSKVSKHEACVTKRKKQADGVRATKHKFVTKGRKHETAIKGG